MIDLDSPEVKGFWASIDASPESDLPVEVFADWLEERGHEAGHALRSMIAAMGEYLSRCGFMGESKSKFLQNWLEAIADLKAKNFEIMPNPNPDQREALARLGLSVVTFDSLLRRVADPGRTPAAGRREPR